MAVSELCLGTMNFGWTIGKETAFAILDAYHAAGGIFMQAVSVCPDIPLLPATTKAPEEWIGDWIRERGIQRDTLVLASRMTARVHPDDDAATIAGYIRRSCESSLKRLGNDHIDVLICEWQRSLLPIDSTLEAFDQIIKEGLISHVAAANMPLWRAMEAIHYAKTHQRHGFAGLQLKYSALLHETETEDIADLCGDYKVGLLATSTLGGTAVRGYQRKLPAACAPIGVHHNATVEQLALAWALATPQVASAIIGVSSTTQLEQLLAATSINLSREEVATIGSDAPAQQSAP